MTIQTNWTAYTGSDEQIAEMRESENGFVCRNKGTESGILTIKYGQLFSNTSKYPILDVVWDGSLKRFIETNNTTHYLICQPHQHAEMIERWAHTGQPVWVRTNPFDWDVSIPSHYATTTPDWNIPNAEYSFTSFQE